MSDDIVITVAGQRFEGWVKSSFTAGLDTITSGIELDFSDRWPGHPEQWGIATGYASTVTIGGELLQTGWIDEHEPSYDDEDHTPQIRGRGRCGDLVDCSAMNSPGKWSGRKLEQIVADLTKPFGIKVITTADTGEVFKTFALQQGEQVKDAIDRMTRQRGVLAVESPAGDLQLITPGQTRAAGALQEGVNILKAKAKHSNLQRFSLYVVKGSRKGDDQDFGATVAQVSSQAVDPAVTRYRPLMVMADEQVDGGAAGDLAQFIASVRAARAQSATITVEGFRDVAGALWRPNTIIPLTSPSLGIEGDMLISEVKLLAADDGRTAELTVVRPEAYSLGSIKGRSAARLITGHAGRGAKAKKGRKGKAASNVNAYAALVNADGGG